MKDRKLKAFIATIALLAFAGLPNASAELRVVTYNTKKRPASNDPGHGDTNNWIGALTAIGDSESDAGVIRAPDIMAVQEIPYTSRAFSELGEDPFDSPANIAALLNDVNGVTTYTSFRGTQGDGWNTQGYVWNTATVELIGSPQHDWIGTRPAIRMRFRPVGYTNPDAEFYVYNVHLKAFPEDEPRRFGEAQTLRNYADALGDGTNILYAGDFNFTEFDTGEERGYDWLVSHPGAGLAVDPADGGDTYWDRTYPSTGGGGSRLDYIFMTEEMDDGEGLSLIDDGYKVIGPTYIEELGRYDVRPNELKFATDHLPVSGDYQHPAWMSADAVTESITGPVIVGANASLDVSVENIAPATVVAGADELEYSIVGTGAVTGAANGTDLALGGGNDHTFALDTATAGLRTGRIDVTSSSPAVQDGSYSEDVSLTVLDHSQGSFASGSDVDMLPIDLGNHVPGATVSEVGFAVHNLEATPGYTAALCLDHIVASGDTDVLTTNLQLPLAGPLDGGEGESFLAFMDTTRQGVVSAMYTIENSDLGLPGAMAGTDLVLELTGYVAIDGDLDVDRQVGGTDLNVLLSHYGATSGSGWGDGDFTFDGAVDGTDLNRLLANYGTQLNGGLTGDLGGQEVPEPTMLAMLLSTGPLALVFRRRMIGDRSR